MSDRLEEIRFLVSIAIEGSFAAVEGRALVEEIDRLVAETQRLTRERDELATWKAHVVEPCIACGAPMLLICGVCSDKHWNEKLTALRAAGQRLHDTAEAYRHHDERRSWIDDADALDAAFVGWARLTTKEPTP